MILNIDDLYILTYSNPFYNVKVSLNIILSISKVLVAYFPCIKVSQIVVSITINSMEGKNKS